MGDGDASIRIDPLTCPTIMRVQLACSHCKSHCRVTGGGPIATGQPPQKLAHDSGRISALVPIGRSAALLTH